MKTQRSTSKDNQSKSTGYTTSLYPYVPLHNHDYALFQRNKVISDIMFGPSPDYDIDLPQYLSPRYNEFYINNLVIQVLMREFWFMLQIYTQNGLPLELTIYTFMTMVCE